jgi:integrase
MKSLYTANEITGRTARRQAHAPSFAKVFNGRKQPIRALWIRNGRYYAQLKVENPITGIKNTRRIPLCDENGNPVQTASQAVAELQRLHYQRRKNTLPVLGQTPLFRDYAAHYLKSIDAGQGAKKPATVKKEKGILKRWAKQIGSYRIDQVRPYHIAKFLEARQAEGVSPRSVNIDAITIRVLLKRALREGRIQRLPTEGWQALKTTTPIRPLFTAADLDKVCAAAFETKKDKKGRAVPVTENAQEFTDYIRLLAYSGARRNEALALRWQDVDFEREQLTIGAAGDTKNRTGRVLDFNPKLKAHLQAMQKRAHNVSDFLFPSPQRGGKDFAAKTFQESLKLARERAEMPDFTFHDCRHHFISTCVMAGVDFMTIASWVGHRDGGILIGKVYGHLANEHRRAMAQRVAFEPTILKETANA